MRSSVEVGEAFAPGGCLKSSASDIPPCRTASTTRGRSNFIRAPLCAAILGSFVGTSSALDIRYWVWQRDDPLDQNEIAELKTQNAETIYWQVGELENSGDNWHWKARFDFPESDENGIRFVPVVRLVSRERQPFSPASLAALVARLTAIARDHDELQLDYDAPDRLLSEYSAALKQIHQIAHRLTITALPHWSRPDCLRTLESSVDEFLPMLYDFEGEPALKNDSPLPLIAPQKISKLIADWRACKKTWRAGLPVFARLSVYDSNGKLRGQIRNWNWDELCFNRSFRMARAGQFETFALSVIRPGAIANTPINPGEQIIVRETDRQALRDAIGAAVNAGAKSVVFFRLPDASASSGWSLRQIAHLDASPRLHARYSAVEQSLELSNEGDADLEPVFPGKSGRDGGYSLEVQSEAAIFREAHAGDFAGLTSYTGEKQVAIPFATRWQLKFSQLRSGQKLTSGLIQLAPGADFRQARYRILNLEGGSSWKNFE